MSPLGRPQLHSEDVRTQEAALTRYTFRRGRSTVSDRYITTLPEGETLVGRAVYIRMNVKAVVCLSLIIAELHAFKNRE